ncbi:cis-prenyltransferase [Schizosaccharomyces japonicus yFS275]|uniref:Alkyl transferase n=1 Tax=Schizosaccharomyces japonicus (strain yFS275 / FY16936) TaxID=402676 RepID=B6K1Q2_SCHJY|nr:cis-prenyltransferase [Schizosaccharomyces japonicus yFS275]EEB07083.1 cis-prenyltransferase [Schizosaccharomyces japonicus yFS275]
MGNLMEWLKNCPPLQWAEDKFEDLMVNIIRCSSVPQHIGFVMDGNRRWARQHRMETAEGHSLGFETLKDLLRVCLRLGVKEVSAFGFSLENFKRSKYEVDMIMEIAKSSLAQICSHGDLVDQYNIRIRVVGDLDRLPDDLHEQFVKIMKRTEKNTGATLNLCFPYTSRYEITQSLQRLVKKAEDGRLTPDEIDEKVFEKCLLITDSHPLDILVRTSGVKRLSDFMLWQCHENTDIQFVRNYWPDFKVWRFLPMILRYQIDQKAKS